MKIKEKILLITGGTGSFGNAVLANFLNTSHFKEIRIFSRDEKKQDDMRKYYSNSKIKFFIGDVRDKDRLDFAINDEIIRDVDPNSPWTGNVTSMKTRGVFINFTFR